MWEDPPWSEQVRGAEAAPTFRQHQLPKQVKPSRVEPVEPVYVTSEAGSSFRMECL